MRLELGIIDRADCIGAGLKAEQLARAHGWAHQAASEAKLVVVELGSNAVRHGRGGTCTLCFDDQGLVITVEDHGPGLPAWALQGQPAPAMGLVERRQAGLRGLGGGLDCVRRLSDQLTLTNLPGGGARVIARRASSKPQRKQH